MRIIGVHLDVHGLCLEIANSFLLYKSKYQFTEVNKTAAKRDAVSTAIEGLIHGKVEAAVKIHTRKGLVPL